MPRRGAPPLRFSADGPRQLADQIADKLRQERIAQIADTSDGAQPETITSAPDPESWRRARKYLDELMIREGGQTHRSLAADPGGDTRYGVTKIALKEWHRLHPSGQLPNGIQVPKELEDLTPDQARALLINRAWDRYGLDQVKDDNIAFHLFDMLTTSGPQGVAKIIYPAVNEVSHQAGLYDQSHPLFDRQFHQLQMPSRGENKAEDHTFGQIMARINLLGELGLTQQLQRALVTHRLGYLQTLPNHKANPGWIPRTNFFWPTSTPPEGGYD